jgi:uncharacterized protein YdiU (UPF0061 family)
VQPVAHVTGSSSLRIDELTFHDRFVSTLPADPSTAPGSRQVLGACYSLVAPTPVRLPELIALVPEVAEILQLSSAKTPELAAVLGGNRLVTGMKPYAACYGGHQFGNWAGQLGDGRAMTLGEVLGADGRSWELQLKGAGPTPYSRRADGRAVLRSSLRELVASEAMHHLGVQTTRALSLVTTGDLVERDLLYDGHPRFEPGAIVCRVAPSFLRFGSYELFASRGDAETLGRLTRYTLQAFYPGFVSGDSLDVPAFVEEVCRRTARLVVDWMRVGFVHGVMNTDNMSILGLTLDYGPFGFMDAFDPAFTPNITDAGGRRYRFENQTRIAAWNVARFAQSLVPLVGDVAPLEHALGAFADELSRVEPRMFLQKLGLTANPDSAEEDEHLVSALFAFLSDVETDMPLFFRRLASVALPEDARAPRTEVLGDAWYAPGGPTAAQQERLHEWLRRYARRARRESVSDDERHARMNRVNPLYLPRNYLLQRVIEQTEAGDTTALPELLAVLRHPYDEQPGKAAFAEKRPDWAKNKPGSSMLSCSS